MQPATLKSEREYILVRHLNDRNMQNIFVTTVVATAAVTKKYLWLETLRNSADVTADASHLKTEKAELTEQRKQARYHRWGVGAFSGYW